MVYLGRCEGSRYTFFGSDARIAEMEVLPRDEVVRRDKESSAETSI